MNYNPIYMKGESGFKKYYKIIDVNTESSVREISTFLSTKETSEKNEMVVHFSIPPSFYIIQPFQK
jgi:glucose-6-phosphate 1-dehydrogenase